MLLLLLVQSLARRHNKYFQITFKDQCYYGNRDEMKHLYQYASPLETENCKQIHHLWSLAETFQYGNWCGKSYGGFNNECKQLCLKDTNVPSQECINCDPPIDWVDEQCMYHDFCMTRFESFDIGYGGACSDDFNLGNPFPSPCDCAQNLTEHLNFSYLLQTFTQFSDHCFLDLDCQMNGEIIYNFFDSDIMKCSCSYKQCNNNTIDEDGNFVDSGDPLDCWNATACVNVEQCAALVGD